MHKSSEDIIKSNFKGLPVYRSEDDIYNQSKEEENIDPENILKEKAPNNNEGIYNVKELTEDMDINDLDVPGSELDDDMEIDGNEDEENNYYSLGGDDHNDLDEDKGE